MTIRTSLPLALLLALLTTAPAAAMIAPAPPAPPGWVYRWIPATYRTIFDRLWIPEQCTPVVDWVEISPGHYVQQWRALLTPGHWQTTTRRELLDPGHWELVALAPPPRPPHRPFPVEPMPMPLPRPVVVAPTGTVPVEGYSSGTGEDLSAFSGLREWPDKH